MKAICKGVVIAEGDDVVLVEGDHYFLEGDLKRTHITFSNHKSYGWKGLANYYSLLIEGDLITDAVWFHPDPTPEAELVRGRVAFGKPVAVLP